MTTILKYFVAGSLLLSAVSSYSEDYQKATFFGVYAAIGMLMVERYERLK